jgi:predicted DsbA family dithiol-disulfide isomerase/riboflavin biosynthesis pyrimidine reductase
MSLTIPVAHDFTCSWCWIGLHQTLRMRRDFDATIEWMGYEMYPEDTPLPPADPPSAQAPPHPPVPTRAELAFAAEGLPMPERRPPIRTHAAHEAVEWAKTQGGADLLVQAIYRAYWEEGRDVSDEEVLSELARGLGLASQSMLEAIRSRRFARSIIGFDDEAYRSGVHHIPTFTIGGERFAEQPYRVLEAALRRFDSNPLKGLYLHPEFPEPPAHRPYIFIDMVSTIDGKTVSGDRGEDVLDLGSKFDHQVLRRLVDHADAVLLGAGTLRATPASWSPAVRHRVVLTASGRIEGNHGFLGSGGIVAGPHAALEGLPEGIERWGFDGEGADPIELLRRLRVEKGVRRLLVLGGSEINGMLLGLEVVDELFLTLAPKVKLGRGVPTYAGGEPLPRGRIQQFRLVEHHRVGDELFVRYRRTEP